MVRPPRDPSGAGRTLAEALSTKAGGGGVGTVTPCVALHVP